jgi:hypothetical protein
MRKLLVALALAFAAIGVVSASGCKTASTGCSSCGG